jgi:hypothetical protein
MNSFQSARHEAGLRRQEIAFQARLRREEMHWNSHTHREEIRWEVQLENFRRSDRAAVDIGIVALKTAILINAGSIAAILALAGQLWKDEKVVARSVFSNSHAFVWGLMLAAAAVGIAYFYQSFVTYKADQVLKRIYKGEEVDTLRSVDFIVAAFAILMVGFTSAAYVKFVEGVVGLMLVLN